MNRAGVTTREHVGVGVTLLRLRELVSAYATEVSLATEKVRTDTEREFLTQHAKAVQAYRDSLAVWDAKIKDGVMLTASTTPRTEGLIVIADRYGLEGKLVGTLFTFSADDGLQKIWMQASGDLDVADRLLRGTP